MPDDTAVLTSPHNPSVKYARSLLARKTRYRERAFLVEGPRAVGDALLTGAAPRLLFVVEDRVEEVRDLLDRARSAGARVQVASRKLIDLLSDTRTPQGVIAVFPFPDVEPLTGAEGPPLVLAIDAVQDPGNLGTLLRSACAAGATAVLIGPGTVDPYAPKVVRGAMGAHFRIAIGEIAWRDPAPALGPRGQCVAAALGAPLAYDELDWREPSALLIGNEARGLSGDARAIATHSVSIPLKGGIESLNAGVAGSIILFEAARQRRARIVQ